MKISLEFDSVGELKYFCENLTFTPAYRSAKEEPKKEEPTPVKKEEPAPVKKEEPAPVKKEEETIAVVDVRKLLSIVNKKSNGKNVAKEWIAEEGFKSLADIKDQEVLKRLMRKAEEAIDAE